MISPRGTKDNVRPRLTLEPFHCVSEACAKPHIWEVGKQSGDKLEGNLVAPL